MVTYRFYLGPLVIPEQAPYQSQVTKLSYFVNYKGRKVQLSSSLYVKSDNMLSYDDILEIEETIKQGVLPVQKEERSKFVYWSVPSLVEKEHWLSLMLDEEGQALAFYKGKLERRQDKVYSTSSFISIRPDQRGKGHCTRFATFTFASLGKLVDGIELVNGASNSQAACSCYTAAGLALGYKVYLKDLGRDSYRRVNKRQTECNFLLLVTR
nr:hypothetical protein Cbor_145 [Cedratvirus borely]